MDVDGDFVPDLIYLDGYESRVAYWKRNTCTGNGMLLLYAVPGQ